MTNTEFKIELLKREIEALRSVISEWDIDKTCFTQMEVADACRRLLEVIK